MVFLYNTRCTFSKKTGDIEFGEMAWLVPIEAITTIKMEKVAAKNKIQFDLTTDLQCQNKILEKHGLKKIAKTERNIEFNLSRLTTARDFLWHIKRIHHWWNFAQPTGEKNNGKELIINDVTKKEKGAE